MGAICRTQVYFPSLTHTLLSLPRCLLTFSSSALFYEVAVFSDLVVNALCFGRFDVPTFVSGGGVLSIRFEGTYQAPLLAIQACRVHKPG
jgi:hypothetical protein